MKTKPSQSKYSGQCETCKILHRAILLINSGLIPPPIITVACGCKIPVTQVKLIYCGQ